MDGQIVINPELIPYTRVKSELTTLKWIMHHTGQRGVILPSYRGQSLSHESHVEVVKFKQRCIVWWPGIYREVEEYMTVHLVCLVANQERQLYHPYSLSTGPPSHGSIFSSSPSAILVVYDLHWKWPDVVSMGSVTAPAIVDCLEQRFSLWGIPQVVTTDNGQQFISSEFSSYILAKGITYICTSYYYPQANDGVKRFNRSLKNLTCVYLTQGFSFRASLSQTLLHHRDTLHATTGASHVSLMLGST